MSNQEKDIRENSNKIRILSQKLTIKMLEEAAKMDVSKEWPKITAAVDKGTKYLALENKIEDEGFGSAFENDDEDDDDE